MAPSHVKKEEAELRQIAKQSRTARKEALERERKQRQRALRAAAKNGGADAAAPSDDAAAAPKKKRGAIIMPDEVTEMRQRLLGDDASSSVADSSSKKKNNKKATRAANKKAGAAAATTAAATPSSSASSSFLVPTYHQEVHFKKQIFFVDVVLHHVPHQKIDVSETTAEQLVVDTSAFTKKYRLVLPFPDGMRCDVAAANFDFEQGVLSCKMPILEGTLPAGLQEENEKMVEKMRQQKALRFRVSQDGDLTVRTRQALLAPTPAAQAALLQAAKDAKKPEDDEDSKKESAKSKKRARGAAAAEEEDGEGVEEGLPAKASKKNAKTAAAAAAAAPAKAAKPDVFQTEHAKAMEAAKAAADKVHLSMREKMKLAKTVQASRQVRLQTRSQRKERKEEQKQNSFQRVLEEQKRQLLARAAMQQPQAPRASAKTDGPAKSVRFANA